MRERDHLVFILDIIADEVNRLKRLIKLEPCADDNGECWSMFNNLECHIAETIVANSIAALLEFQNDNREQLLEKIRNYRIWKQYESTDEILARIKKEHTECSVVI